MHQAVNLHRGYKLLITCALCFLLVACGSGSASSSTTPTPSTSTSGQGTTNSGTDGTSGGTETESGEGDSGENGSGEGNSDETDTGETDTEDTEETESSNTTPADTVILNARIYTVNPDSPGATHLAIRDGEIIYIGNEMPQEYIGENTTQIQAEQRMVMPGIHDVHIHPLESASEATHFSLDEAEQDPENYAADVEQAARDFPDAEWLIGYGHLIDTLLFANRSAKDILDDVVPDRPVIIMEQTSHSMWVNSMALEMAGINANTTDPTGGFIGREDNGDPDGILYDNAGDIVMEQAMIASNTGNSDFDGLVEYALPQLNRHGVTSISDARVYWQRGQLETWQQVAAQNRLTLRVSLGLWAYPQANDDEQIAELIGMYSNQEDSLLKVNQVKFYMDGILVNTTAAMHQPYLIKMLPIPGNRGLNYFTQERLQTYIEALEPAGFNFNIHAIGDRGITEALNAIERTSMGNARHRLTHLEIVDEDDYARFAQLNVIADAQVAGDFTNPAHWSENVELVGASRSDAIVPIKSLVDNNATLTLSSDWNVSTLNPFVGISNAISRVPQAISLEQAIAAYTINSAYAMKQEHLVGSLEVGKRADLIMLDRDLFESSAAQIKQTKVDLTMLDGDIVYRR